LATQDGKKVEYQTDGVFVFIGLVPNTGFLKNTDVKLDERGFIITNTNLETNMSGVFASGDVRSGATMQIASAVGEGATAALKIREYLEMRERNHATPMLERV
jgi:thioredoxin reductase (NADPH)